MKRTFVYLGKGTPPEIIVKKRGETKFDYTRRSVVTIWIALMELMKAGAPRPDGIEIAGYLKKQITAALENLMRTTLENAKKGDFEKFVASRTHADLENAEHIITQILLGKEAVRKNG